MCTGNFQATFGLNNVRDNRLLPLSCARSRWWNCLRRYLDTKSRTDSKPQKWSPHGLVKDFAVEDFAGPSCRTKASSGHPVRLRGRVQHFSFCAPGVLPQVPFVSLAASFYIVVGGTLLPVGMVKERGTPIGILGPRFFLQGQI